jgi:hypothetical protein
MTQAKHSISFQIPQQNLLNNFNDNDEDNELCDSETFWYLDYLIPNLSDIEPIWYQNISFQT